MRVLSTCLLAFLTQLLLLIEPATAQDTATVAEEALRGTVAVQLETAGEYRTVGSGFFISPEELLSNHHVVQTEGQYRILLQNGRSALLTTFVACSEEDDLVILSVPPSLDVPYYLPLDRRLPRVGETTLAIGCPAGIDFTVSRGIVSSVRRLELFGTVIQTDAAVSPGNSGGPLINTSGEVLGVVTWKLNPDRADDLNLAIPISRAFRLSRHEGRSLSELPGQTTDSGIILSSLSLDLWHREPVGGEALASLPKASQRLVEEVADSYLVVPGEGLINAYAPLAVLDSVVGEDQQFRSFEEAISELGLGSRDVEGDVPPLSLHAETCWIDTEFRSASMRVITPISEEMTVVTAPWDDSPILLLGDSFQYRTTGTEIYGGYCLRLAGRVSVPDDPNPLPVYQYFVLHQLRATPEELADWIVRTEEPLVRYHVRPYVTQEERIQRYGTRGERQRVIKVGPRYTKHKWTRIESPLRPLQKHEDNP